MKKFKVKKLPKQFWKLKIKYAIKSLKQFLCVGQKKVLGKGNLNLNYEKQVNYIR